MTFKEFFDVIVGLATIGSFIVTLLALIKVSEIKNIIINGNKVNQSADKAKLDNSSNITMVGRDSRK